MRPHCGEMSRSDRGDGHRLGGGNAVGKFGGSKPPPYGSLYPK